MQPLPMKPPLHVSFDTAPSVHCFAVRPTKSCAKRAAPLAFRKKCPFPRAGNLEREIWISIFPYFCYRRLMDTTDVLAALSALSQATRLEVFRLLVRHEPEGLQAGEIARRLAVPHNTMSAHLGILARAGLIQSERHSRSITYRVVLGQLTAVIGFLLKDCCSGRAEICEPLIAELTPCCSPKETGRA